LAARFPQIANIRLGLIPIVPVFEERERAYKQDLIERIEPRLERGETVAAVAVTQVGAPPTLQILPLLGGIVLVVYSFIAGGSAVGIVGGVLILVGLVALSLASRRVVARTSRAVLVFDLPSSGTGDLEEPIERLPLDDLPSLSGGSVKLAGRRMWPNYGSGLERDALAEVLNGDG